jgi:CRP-like cAMP-binding protein
MAPATLGIVCFRREWPGCDEAETERRGTALAAYVDTAAGQDIIRRWDADRFFYVVLAGRYDVFIDERHIRALGPGDHFGELAARDWGGGYGYARLATVRCAEPGRLMRLTSEDLQWLTEREPAVKSRLAVSLAERLRNR